MPDTMPPPTISDRITGTALPSAYGSAASIERAMSRFGWLGDADDVLSKLGIDRTRLRAIEHDDEVTAALDTRRAACNNTPWRIEHPQARARAFFTAALQPHINAITAAAWSAVPYGYSVQEVVYSAPDAPGSTTPGRIGIGQIIECPFEWFRIDAAGVLWWRDESQPAEAVRFVATVHAGSLRKPHGEALLAKAYWPWFFRTHGWRMWAKFMESAAVPLIYGKTATDKQGMVDLLRTVTSGPVLAVDDRDTLAALDNQGGGSNKFTEFETACQRRIQRLILGQTLTSGTDGGSGNRALGQVHDEVRQEKRRSDIRIVSATVQSIINRLAALNGMEPGTFVMEDGTGLERERAERDQILTSAGMLQFTPTYLQEKYGLEPDDFTAPDAAAPAPVPAAMRATLAARPDSTKPDRRRFTAAQQVIEDEVERTLGNLGSPVAPGAIASAIRQARDPADLLDRLAVVLADADDRDFRRLTERALFAADVMGYVHARQDSPDDGTGSA